MENDTINCRIHCLMTHYVISLLQHEERHLCQNIKAKIRGKLEPKKKKWIENDALDLPKPAPGVN